MVSGKNINKGPNYPWKKEAWGPGKKTQNIAKNVLVSQPSFSHSFQNTNSPVIAYQEERENWLSKTLNRKGLGLCRTMSRDEVVINKLVDIKQFPTSYIISFRAIPQVGNQRILCWKNSTAPKKKASHTDFGQKRLGISLEKIHLPRHHQHMKCIGQ